MHIPTGAAIMLSVMLYAPSASYFAWLLTTLYVPAIYGSSATAYSALAARRETELVLMSEELLDVELRERVKKVRKNSVQRRLRDLVRTMHVWRAAVMMVEALKSATEQTQTAQWCYRSLTDASFALEDLASDVNGQADQMRVMVSANEILSAQAQELQLSTLSLKEEVASHTS